MQLCRILTPAAGGAITSSSAVAAWRRRSTPARPSTDDERQDLNRYTRQEESGLGSVGGGLTPTEQEAEEIARAEAGEPVFTHASGAQDYELQAGPSPFSREAEQPPRASASGEPHFAANDSSRSWLSSDDLSTRLQAASDRAGSAGMDARSSLADKPHESKSSWEFGGQPPGDLEPPKPITEEREGHAIPNESPSTH